MELLSPAGNMAAAHAAINAGADAIYIGGGFSARAYAENFSDAETEKIIEYAHLMGKRVYAAVNIMIFDDEFEAALCHVDILCRLGIDAIIAADMGLIAECKRRFPNLPVHISTQAGIHEKMGALLMQRLGAERVVPARETTLEGLKEIANTGIEVEAFCHGALCSGYSGACLMSSMIGGRSGNRGKCAQPCRLPYTLDGKEGYLLSTADLCTVEMLDKLEDAGVCSLKIEGRMKRAEYVAGVTSEYRAAIDGSHAKGSVMRLKQTFNRGGFTRGYFEGNFDVTYTQRPDHIGVRIGVVEKLMGKNKAVISTAVKLEKLDALSFVSKDVRSIVIGYADKCNGGYIIPIPAGVNKGDEVYRTASESQLTEQRRIIADDGTAAASAELFISDNCEGYLMMQSGDSFASVSIPRCESARNDVNEEKLAASIRKTGNTGVAVSDVNITIDGRPFISASELNGVRRECVDRLKEEILNNARRYEHILSKGMELEEKRYSEKMDIAVSVTLPEQARAAFAAGADRVYVYANANTRHDDFKDIEGKLYIVAAPFSTKADMERLKEIKDIYDGVLCCGWGEFEASKDIFEDVRCDFLMNIANSYTQALVNELGAEGHCVSAEAHIEQLKLLRYPFEMVAYGHIPLITMRHCPLKKEGKCGECGTAYLTDRKGYEMRFLRTGLKECQCVLLNSVLTAIEDISAVKAVGADALRLMFFYEDADKVYEITKMYKEAISGGIIKIEEEHNSAHLYRGV